MSLYATLDEVKVELLAESTTDDDKILRGIRQVSRRIDGMFLAKRPLFVPMIQTRRVALDGLSVNSMDGTLLLRWPLLSLTGASINSQTLTVGTNVQAYPIDEIPYPQLQLMGDCWASWYAAYCSGARGAQYAAVTGIWGYNADYANAWLAVDVVTTTAITTTTATTFTVADVDGVNLLGDAPRISAGNVIQIDSEWMDVAATDALTNTVTVRRGVNGSTAALHAIGAVVSVYSVDESIKRAVVRQVSFQYSRRGAFDTVRYGDISTVAFPKDILDEVYGLLRQFANM